MEELREGNKLWKIVGYGSNPPIVGWRLFGSAIRVSNSLVRGHGNTVWAQPVRHMKPGVQKIA